MSDKVRLASVGLGWWGNVLAEAEVTGGAEIAGGFARTSETRDAFTSKQGGKPYASFEELLADAEVDGVLLATPHTAHVDQIVAAAEAGKHVFIEKPLTLEVAGAKRAIAAAEAAEGVEHETEGGHGDRGKGG